MSRYSLSYCASSCVLIDAMPSAEATTAASYTEVSTSFFPFACARANSASNFCWMVSKPSTSAAVSLYLISMASRVSTSSCSRSFSLLLNFPDCLRLRRRVISVSMLSSVLISCSICTDSVEKPAPFASVCISCSDSLVVAVMSLKEPVHSSMTAFFLYFPSVQTPSKLFIHSVAFFLSRLKSSALRPKKEKPLLA